MLATGPCTNCGAGPVARYCAACGQRHIAPHDCTARVFFRETLSELVSVDGRFWLTLWALLRHPGKLAREYFDGRGARYMRPLNLFLLLNLVVFVVQPHTGLLQWHLQGYLAGDARAHDRVNETRLARAIAASYVFRVHRLAEHLIFSTWAAPLLRARRPDVSGHPVGDVAPA